MKLPRKTFCFMLFVAHFGSFPTVRAEDPAPEAKPRDLGPPLVDNAKDLKQLGKYAAWLDPKNKQVVIVGETCKAGYGLEFLVTTKGRAYESVLVIDPPPRKQGELSIFQQIHAALLLLGASPGHPAYYDQKLDKTYIATGDEIGIAVCWKDKNGKTQSADARTWIRDMKSKKSPAANWVFGGSQFLKVAGGQNRYLGDSGDFICVLNNPIAMLDLPILSSGAIESRLFEANADVMPPPETPVTIILKPKLKPKGK
jgi:hypothetical protein